MRDITYKQVSVAAVVIGSIAMMIDSGLASAAAFIASLGLIAWHLYLDRVEDKTVATLKADVKELKDQMQGYMIAQGLRR